jgi:hypothetical protein
MAALCCVYAGRYFDFRRIPAPLAIYSNSDNTTSTRHLEVESGLAYMFIESEIERDNDRRPGITFLAPWASGAWLTIQVNGVEKWHKGLDANAKDLR